MEKNNFAVIFDMDGVMVNNNPYHKKAWKTFVQSHGFDFSEEDLKQNIYGKTNHDILTFVFGSKITEEEIHQYAVEKEKIYEVLYRDFIKPVNGLVEFLDLLYSKNISIAIATSAPPQNVKFVLTAIDVKKYFNIIVDDTEVKKGKPDPEIYLTTAKKLNIDPSNCVVFEDSLSGVQAALNAKMKVVAITTTHTKEELSNANLVVDDFYEVDLDALGLL